MKKTRDGFTYSERLKSARELEKKHGKRESVLDGVELTQEQRAEVEQFMAGKLQYRDLSRDASMWLSIMSLNEQRKNPILYSDLPKYLEQETWAPRDAMLILAGVDPAAVIMDWSYENFMGAEIDEPRIRHANWFTSASDLYDYPIPEDFSYSIPELNKLIREAKEGSTAEERAELQKRLAEVERWANDDRSKFKREILRLRSEMVGILKKRWDSGDHDTLQRRSPQFFVRWAESRDFEIEWAAWAREHGHTLQACIEQATRVTGIAPQEAYADRGYKGHGCNTDSFKVWISGTKRGVTDAIHRKLKRRNAVEPVIGHLKSDGRLARNFLKGVQGDAMNALLCGAGHNMRKILRKLRLFCALCGFTLRQLLALLLPPTMFERIAASEIQ